MLRDQNEAPLTGFAFQETAQLVQVGPGPEGFQHLIAAA